MIRICGESFYCCEICNESYGYVRVYNGTKLIWESSWIDPYDTISMSELKEELIEVLAKFGIKPSQIKGFDGYIGDWEL